MLNPAQALYTTVSFIVQGELTEAVKALDLGTQAAEAELKLASEAASSFIKLSLTCRPEPKSAAPLRPVGKLKANPIQQNLQGVQAPVLSGPSALSSASATQGLSKPASR